ncbi:MAG: hypothetical protein K1X64_20535 [Myxococcaceae bacterium]|nr:hypothetical protein [Myxococcaceae bacterium]
MLLTRWFSVASLTLAAVSLAQTGEPAPRVIVVPLPGEMTDAGVAQAAPEVTVPVATAPVDAGARLADAPMAAVDGGVLLESNLAPVIEPSAPTAVVPDSSVSGNGMMLDGHPREGSFLSGPGSLTFVVHHTLLGAFGGLSTQLVPRAARALSDPTYNAADADARLSYLAGTLIGAGMGFGVAAWWQFNHWISWSTANYSIVNSIIGGLLFGGLTNLATDDPAVHAWLAWLGSEAGAWLTAILGGGDMAVNKGLLISSGAGWATIYTALVVAIVATTGNGSRLRSGVDALMIAPGVGAVALALAALRFNPTSEQVLRADVFGAGAGGAVLLISALVLGGVGGFTSPVPYVLAGVAAAGAITTVSLLWADDVDTTAPAPAPVSDLGNRLRRRAYTSLWW